MESIVSIGRCGLLDVGNRNGGEIKVFSALEDSECKSMGIVSIKRCASTSSLRFRFMVVGHVNVRK
jgi:hypothetical protein